MGIPIYDLKPCPFCGSIDLYIQNNCENIYWVDCKNCKAEGSIIRGNEKDAVRTWNKRIEFENKIEQIKKWYNKNKYAIEMGVHSDEVKEIEKELIDILR
jgi:Lar family restriction alleviation protein